VNFSSEKVVKVSFTVTPTTDVVLPPLTSKVVKNLILSGKLLSSLSQLVNSSAKNKPIFISNLGYNGKRLFSTGKPLTARAGQRLDFFISFPYYDNLHEELKEGCFDTHYGRFCIQLSEVYIADLNMIKAVSPKGKNFLVTFVAPTLLSSKVLLPSSLDRKFKGINPGFSLIPSVGLIVNYAFRTYHALLGNTSNQEYNVRAYKLAILSNALSRIVGYDLKPVTVVIGEDDKGNLRTTRGFIGWMEFDIVYEKLKRAVTKYLLFTSVLGIGRSRGIGFGEVRVELKDQS
jgi:CRISPR-associated endoribonuclease Cas6